MKILKSYYKTPSFLTGRCIVSLAILGLISCSDRNGKSLSEATNDPAGIYREYLYNIRRQKDSSFQVLTEHILPVSYTHLDVYKRQLDEYFTYGYGARHLWVCQRRPSDKTKIFEYRIMMVEFQ